MDKALSSDEVSMLVGYKANYLNYRDFARYNNIYDAMGKYRALILLYLSKPSYGHFTCVFERDNNTIEFFDSIGTFKLPDDELELISEEQRVINNEVKPHLLKLLYDTKKHIEYCDFPLQSKNPNIKTCGRHVAIRLHLRFLNIDEYIDLMNYLTKKLNLRSIDELVTMLTSFV